VVRQSSETNTRQIDNPGRLNIFMSDHSYKKRELSPSEVQVIEEIAKAKRTYSDIVGYVTTTQDVKLITWNGKHPSEDNMEERVVKAGSTLKIVMFSKYNDFGLTDDLTATHIYKVRIPSDSDLISDIRKTEEPTSFHTKLYDVETYGNNG